MPDEVLLSLLRDAKELAKRYYVATGRPLGVTGEIAELEASRLLGLTLEKARTAGFDATAEREGGVIRYQIKGRAIGAGTGRSQRVGSLKLDKPWDAALLVVLGPDFETREIWEASREQLTKELTKPGSKSRNVRGALAVAQFKRVAVKLWPVPTK